MPTLHETCQQYVARRLSEGWRIISQIGFSVILQSPEGIIRPVDLRNDIETLRPNAAGDEENIATVYGDGVGTHYITVDEVTSDDDTTYVEDIGTILYTRDLYNLPPHSAGSGTINSVTVYANAKATGTPTQVSLKNAHKTGGIAYEGTAVTVTTSYALYSTAWTTNLQTGLAWTWDDIDALQIGVSVRRAGTGYYTRVTQVYVEVDYTPAAAGRSFGFIIG